MEVLKQEVLTEGILTKNSHAITSHHLKDAVVAMLHNPCNELQEAQVVYLK